MLENQTWSLGFECRNFFCKILGLLLLFSKVYVAEDEDTTLLVHLVHLSFLLGDGRQSLDH
jgi:hypothetical protein